jgi:hypothetical protein
MKSALASRCTLLSTAILEKRTAWATPAPAGKPGQLAAIMKNRLKRIQYRPGLIDGFLAQTGVSIEPEPP